MAHILDNNMQPTSLHTSAIPIELAMRLLELDCSIDDFPKLGIAIEEALRMDKPTLKRLINERLGVVEAFKEEREKTVKEENIKFFKGLNGQNRILF